MKKVFTNSKNKTMTNETYGIDAIYPAIDVAIGFPMQAAKTIKNKFKLLDILAFIDEFRDLAEVLANKETILLQLKDVDAAEKEKLVAHVKETFDIPDDVVEGFSEDALMWALSTLSLIKRAKDLRNRPR